MEKNDITILFEDIPLYKDFLFELYSEYDDDSDQYIIKKENLDLIFKFLGILKKENLITDCITCGGRFPFSLSLVSIRDAVKTNGFFLGRDEGEIQYLYFGNFRNNQNYYVDKESVHMFDESFYLDYYFYCSNDAKHIYKMEIFIEKIDKNLAIRKIGQYPENTLLGSFDSDKYKNILRRFNDSYIDYQNAEKSYRYGLYSGAYDYLRRVYENMINYYILRKAPNLPNNPNTEQKINSIKSCFDTRIQHLLYPLYSALSCGIHTMKEEECKKRFNDLKIILDIQLQFVKSNDELENKISNSSASLTELTQKYAKKK